MISKNKRIVSPTNIKSCQRDYCEICGRPCSGEPHHVITRGAGGPDLDINLIQLCGTCHRKAHNGKYKKEYLFAIISRRLGIEEEELFEKIQKIRGRDTYDF